VRGAIILSLVVFLESINKQHVCHLPPIFKSVTYGILLQKFGQHNNNYVAEYIMTEA
jgi:hypothetical protein